MKIPTNTKTYEFRNSTVWFDEQGILYSMPKPVSVPATLDEMKSDIDRIWKIMGNKKACIIIESGADSKPVKKEERDFIADEFSKLAKAMAIITHSPLSRMIANLFFGLKPPQYPVKMFTDEQEAREWIKQYL